MNADRDLVRQDVSTEELNELILTCIQDKKAKGVVKLDLRKVEEAPTDYFFICHGDSHTQVKAIADHIIGKVKKEAKELPNHVEGKTNSSWILVDYFTTVVHIFYQETREFYKLEELWSDGEKTSYEEL